MKYVFLSLPINGKTDEEVKAAREKAKKEIQSILYNESLKFIDSWITEEPPHYLTGSKVGLWYLAKSLEKLADADAIYCAKDWANYRGCVIEKNAAKQYGIDVYTYSQYLMSQGLPSNNI
jgi:hypothetical protein